MSIPCVANVISDFFGSDGDSSKIDARCIEERSEPAW
jgi:hypothetical protein